MVASKVQPLVERLNDKFGAVARWAATISGSALTFCIALLVILVWAISGPFFHYSDTWQLTVNTGTTIVTFLMVFLIQNAQNRDARALHLKLDELIRTSSRARNQMIDLEKLTDKQLERLQEEFNRLCADDPEDRREAVHRVADDDRRNPGLRPSEAAH